MSTGHRDHTDTVREQFRIQSGQFEQQVGGLSNRAIGPWILENLGLTGSESVLDVATGTGLMARDLAGHVKHVTGIDVTPEMLQQARELAAGAGIPNVHFDDGDATALPYSDDRFDMVISRIAVHHFADPTVELGEMCRVCKPDGKVVIVDITASNDPSLADAHNQLERLRDPSHTTAFPISQLRDLAGQCALRVAHSSEADAARDLDEWMDLTATPQDVRDHINAAFEADLSGGASTGMRAHREDGRVKFIHHWVVLVCELDGSGH